MATTRVMGSRILPQRDPPFSRNSVSDSFDDRSGMRQIVARRIEHAGAVSPPRVATQGFCYGVVDANRAPHQPGGGLDSYWRKKLSGRPNKSDTGPGFRKQIEHRQDFAAKPPTPCPARVPSG